MFNINNEFYQQDIMSTIPYISKLIAGKPNPSILVIGASGLIGSYIVDSLISYNKSIDDCINIYAMSRSYQKIKDRFSYCTSQKLNLMSHNIINELPCDINWDYIFHLASYADPKSYSMYPYETITINVKGTDNIIQYLKNHENTKILFTSTMEVYGNSNKEYYFEDDYGEIDINNLRSGYPISKITSELMYRSAVKEYGINCVIVRLGYIYGATMSDSDNKIIAEFIRNILLNEELVLKSTGLQKRNYCYVSDAVNGMITALIDGKNGECYNISDKNSEISLYELSQLISDMYSINVKYENNPSTLTNKLMNMDKIEKLGWSANINLSQGIERVVNILK